MRNFELAMTDDLYMRTNDIFLYDVNRKQGKTKLFGFFVGKTLAASGGRADPVSINKLLKEMLAE